MKTEFVLIDFENVQPKDLALLNVGSYKIKVFLGKHQDRIPVAVAGALQAFGPDVEYVQVNGSGKNALDFHIAYYVGRLAATAPDGHFHVISKDTGFDPLITHLQGQGVSCRRSISIADVRQLSGAVVGSESLGGKVAAVIENLGKRKSGRPRTVKTLRTTIRALLGSQLMEDELDRVVEELTRRGAVTIADGKVQYDRA